MRGIQYLHPRMIGLANKLVLECDKKGLKIKITDTWRTKSEQDKIPSANTQVKYPHSYHCWGIAFDICRNDGRGIYDDNDGFFAKVGKIANSIGLDWGGNLWTDFVDKPHFQISTFGTPKQLINKYGTPENFKKTWASAPAKPHPLKIKYGFSDDTINYLEAYIHADALVNALISRKPLSNDTKNYILKYKYGKSILGKVYEI